MGEFQPALPSGPSESLLKIFPTGEKTIRPQFRNKGDRQVNTQVPPWDYITHLPGREGEILRTVASALVVSTDPSSLQVSKPTISVWGSYLTSMKIKYMKNIYILSRKKMLYIYVCVSVYPINTFNLHLYAHIQTFFSNINCITSCFVL